MDAHAYACLSLSEFADCSELLVIGSNVDRQDRLESVHGACAGYFARQDRLSKQAGPEK